MAQGDRAKAKHLATCFERRGFTDDEALVLIHAGKSLNEICTHFECNAPVIRRVRERHGLAKFPSAKKPSPWNPTNSAELQRDWLAGVTTAEIGRRLNMSKNAIVGRAGRLDLPARPNPIFEDAPDAMPRQRQRKPRRVTVKCGPKLPQPLPPLPPDPPRPTPPKPHIVAPPPPPPTPIPRYRGKVCECTWPLGEPRTRDFRFCDADSEPGQPYCSEHMQARKLVAA